ncbi:MAG TPA: ATP-binding protein, partial [Aquella sp.]|nr:ATP-binding protein [Aquella sp.]
MPKAKMLSTNQIKDEPSIPVASDTFDVKRELQRERDKFQGLIEQISHDIRSPLSSLSMIVGMCSGIQEEDRIALRNAITRINDITNNLQNEYLKENNKHTVSTIDPYEALLISTALLEVLGEKRYQYKLLNVRFEHNFSQDSHFAFTNMESSIFKRIMSHVLNNAVDSVDQSTGVVTVRLSLDNNMVKVVVQDNGRGMSENVIN